MAAPRSNDYTGREKARLEGAQADQIRQRAKEMSLSVPPEAEVSDEVIDMTPDGVAARAPQPQPKEKAVLGSGDLKIMEITEAPEVRRQAMAIAPDGDEYVVVRLLEDVEDMTYGVGTSFSFEQGRKYKLPRHLAIHLQEKGVVYGVVGAQP